MELIEKYCPSCGKKIKINGEKAFSFCSDCGFKIELARTNVEKKNLLKERNINVDESMDEVKFYYQMSQQRKEAVNKEKNPIYYLKGQDLLREMVEVCDNDYRIWWELSKPVDYGYVEEAKDGENNYMFNEEFFDKALDFASIEVKKELILKREDYEGKKRVIIAEYEKRCERIRKQEEKKAEEEQKKREMEEEESKRIQEELRLQKEQREIESKQKLCDKNKQLWQELSQGIYDRIDDTFFSIAVNHGENYIGLFKVISNVLYLVSFVENTNTKMITRCQSIMVRVDEKGTFVYYDNKAVRVKMNLSEQTVLCISCNGDDTYSISGKALIRDSHYIKNLMINAKKPLFGINKIFF